jgi:hypothetical protein
MPVAAHRDRGPATLCVGRSGAFGLVAATALVAVAPAAAPARAQTLTIGVAAAVTSIDPHYHNLAPNLSMGMHIFDRLVERDARARTYSRPRRILVAIVRHGLGVPPAPRCDVARRARLHGGRRRLHARAGAHRAE